MVVKKLTRSDKEWEKILNAEEFQILRKKGTESPFTGKFVFNKEKGVYVCAGLEISCSLLKISLILVLVGLVFGMSYLKEMSN